MIQRIIHPFAAGTLAVMISAGTAGANPGFVDNFDGPTLDPAWVVSTTATHLLAEPVPVNKYKFSLASSRLVFSDDDPAGAPYASTVASAIDPSAGGYGHVVFTRTLSSPLDDFRVVFDFGWDNNVGNSSPRHPNLAMPILAVILRDATNGIVARAGISDGFFNNVGSSFGQIGTASVSATLPYSSTADNTITLLRTNGQVSISWAGNGTSGFFPFTGFKAEPVTAVQLDFARYRFDSGGSNLGLLDVDFLVVEVPEPSAGLLLGLSGLWWLRRRATRA